MNMTKAKLRELINDIVIIECEASTSTAGSSVSSVRVKYYRESIRRMGPIGRRTELPCNTLHFSWNDFSSLSDERQYELLQRYIAHFETHGNTSGFRFNKKGPQVANARFVTGDGYNRDAVKPLGFKLPEHQRCRSALKSSYSLKRPKGQHSRRRTKMSNFNLKAAAAIAAEGVVLVDVKFDNDHKTYQYLAHEDDKLEAGNIVVVPVDEESVEQQLVTAVSSIENLKLDAEFEPQFIVCKVEQSSYIQRTAGLDDIASLINKNRNRTARSSVLQQFGLEKPLALGAPIEGGE